MNEFDVIRHLSARLPAPPPEVIVPIGDDCAVLRFGDDLWVAATDMLVSGRHFKEWAAPEDVGYKAVAVNVSDVAAMGGTPRFVLASGGADDAETTLRCMEGVLEACEELGAYPLGGDTTGAAALTVDVAILGQLAHPPVLRSGACPGDLLAVTGELGASAAGLLALENGHAGPERLVKKHLRPEPRVTLGRVAARLGAHAMIDLSDGLASDVRHICEKSGVGCRVGLDLLPVAGDTREYLHSAGRDPEILAATGGEDYELLIAAPQEVVEALTAESEMPVTVIGEVTEKEVVFLRGGEPVENLSGWDHFPGA
ncbi:MAG: thiamine-phosphate kinase [Actinomycetota bacterium]|nr:thiamine-phosphate kinase [Actinomycetota bacterium]